MSDAERWLPVVGYETRYEVSDRGRVRTSGADALGRTHYIGQIRKLSLSAGYSSVGLGKAGKMKTWRVHVLVTQAFLGPPPKGQHVNHKNGNRTDPSLENLEYVTRSRNISHAIEDLGKRWCVGENSPFVKFSDAQVVQARQMKANGATNRLIAKTLGASTAWVSLIIRMKERRHDHGEPPYALADVSQKRLTVEEVLKIREMAKTMRKCDIARALGIHQVNIGWIVSRKGWRHI